MKKKMLFNTDVIENTRFMNMSKEAQALYLHLGMNADGDGFIAEPQRIVRRTQSNINDYKELINNKFITTSNVSNGIFLAIDEVKE